MGNSLRHSIKLMKQVSTVLIVDDEIVIRNMIADLLTNEGHQIVFASDGLEAINQAAEILPDLILLDVVMPEMDGFEVCHRLRSHPLLAEVPIIMVTALDDQSSLLKALEAGADDFISKPFDRLELQTRVRTTIRLNRYRRIMTERLKFEWVVERADDGYLILNQHGQILYLNQKARVSLDLHPEDDNSLELAQFTEFIQQYQCEPEVAWENWPHNSDDSQAKFLVRPETPVANAFWLQVDTVAMTMGRRLEYLIRLRDVTERLQSERLMWSFHAQVSHKLRTPLSNLKMSVSYLSDHQDLSPEDMENLVEMADISVNRLNTEIDDIFSYLSIPDITNRSEGLAVPNIIAIANSIKQILEIEEMAVHLEGFSSDDVYLAISQKAFELVLYELLENAKKFHPEKMPRLEIKALLEADQNIVSIQICDDGLALAPEQISQIWVPYYQAEKDFSGQVMGMGLGLSMVASLIRDVGGRYRAYNNPSHPGLVVELNLPIAVHQPDYQKFDTYEEYFNHEPLYPS